MKLTGCFRLPQAHYLGAYDVNRLWVAALQPNQHLSDLFE